MGEKTDHCHPKFQFPDGWDITHSPNHLSTEETVIQYVKNIIVPYIERLRGDIGSKKTALVIIDNFKGEITQSMLNLLESNNILYW